MHFSHTAGPRRDRRRAACWLWLWLWLCLPLQVLAQQLPLRAYGQQDGLGNLAVTAMARDQQGNLWVGTQNGLFRYNGEGFQRYAHGEGLSDAYVTAVLVDHDNRLWVGGYNKLLFKDGERLRPVLRGSQVKIEVLPGQNLALGPDGQRYVVSSQQLYRITMQNGSSQLQPVFSAAQQQQTPALAQVNSVLAEAGGQLWFGCGTALCQHGPGGLVRWGSAQGVPDDSWEAILRDHEGQLWARGTRHIVALPAGAQRFADRTPANSQLRNDALRLLLADDGQGRMLANVDDALLRWQAGRWQRFDAANGLRAGGGINALQLDQDGELWLGTMGQGLQHWRGYDNWENWTSAQGLPDDAILAFANDAGGALYAGTRSGLARLRPGASRFATLTPGRPARKWSAVTADRAGQVWGADAAGKLARVGTDGRLALLPGELPGLHGVLFDRQQQLWTISNTGVSRFDSRPPPALGPRGLEQAADTAAPDITMCQGAGDVLWVLGAQQLLRRAGGQWQHYPPDPQLGDAELGTLSCGADGGLWISDAQSRLWQVTAGPSGVRWRAVAQPLLNDASIVGLHEDRRGWLWVGTDAGVAVWNRQHWRWFNQDDGLVWNDLNGSVFHEAPDGSMWIATSNGASHVLRPELLFAPQHIGVQIAAARRAGQTLAAGAAWRLPWSTAPLELDLSSQLFRNRAQLRFHYRLNGLENGWNSTAAPRVRYAALPPGDYSFEYYASNPSRHSVTAVQTQAVTVLAPWWRTTPFYLLCLSLALLLLAGLYRMRVRHLLHRQRWAEQLVRERTSELERSREQLRQRALRDSLTGAWNRGAMLEIIEQALQQAQARQLPVLLVLLDLDHFKRINDQYGHAAGDAVLRETVQRLGAAVRQEDAVGRYGGEEFLVLLPGLDQASGAARVEQLRRALRSEPIRISDTQAITVTGSFGAIAFQPRQPLPVAELIDRADQALYRSKQQGRDRIEYAAAPAAG